MANNITEPLIQTIDMVVHERLKELPYDTTLKCIIEDNSNKKNGEYIVSNGQYRFTAYSTETNYSKHSSVYVTIPNGDFNERKIIIGKCKDASNVPFNYMSPFDQFVGLTKNYLEGVSQVALTANSQSISRITIFNEDVVIDNTYNRLGVSAEFQANLAKFQVADGTYGIEIRLTTDSGEKFLALDTKDMFGNLYSFAGYSNQEKVFDITTISNISHISVQFVQQQNFIDNDAKLIPVELDIKNNEIPNLFVKDFKLILGYDLASLQEDTIFLFSQDKLSYKFKDGFVDNKNIEMRWAHKDTDNIFRPIESIDNLQDYNINDVSIYWYRQDLTEEYNEELNVPYLGSFWHHQSDWDNTFSQEFKPNGDKQYEKFKVLIKYQDNLFESDILVFENENQVANLATIDLITNMKLICDDGSNGLYPYYDEDGYLINRVEGTRQRKLTFSYTSKITGDKLLDGAETIKWKIPSEDTMIEKPIEKVNSINGYYEIVRDIKNTENNDYETSILDSQYFQIKNFYNPQATNNTIYCIVTRNDIEYTAKIDLLFSIRGNSGTEYTFFISTDKPALLMAQDEKIILTPHLLDYDSKSIPITNIVWKPMRNGEIQSKIQDNNYIITYNENLKNNNSNIIKATTKVNDTILIAYCPIALSSNKNYAFEGPTIITYDNTGANPRYNKLPLNIKNGRDNVENIIWETVLNEDVVPEEQQTSQTIEFKEFLPKIKDNKIYPNKMYLENVNDKLSLVGKVNNKSIWIQPLWIHMDKYQNSLLNQWDGQQKIDNEGNYILSNMVGAGRKESNNTFSGVLMGEIGNKKENPNFNINQKNKTGLFGYDKGVQTFSLDTNGTATLGSSGIGQIKFNGAEGTIESGNYQPIKGNKLGSGMKIDLKNGFLDANGPAGGFNIDFAKKSDSLLKIQGLNQSNQLQPLINIGNQKDDYFIQTADYWRPYVNEANQKVAGKGARLDLAGSSLDVQTGFIGGWEISSKGLKFKGTPPYIRLRDYNKNNVDTLFNTYECYEFVGKTGTYPDGYKRIVRNELVFPGDQTTPLFLKGNQDVSHSTDEEGGGTTTTITRWIPVSYVSKADLNPSLTYYYGAGDNKSPIYDGLIKDLNTPVLYRKNPSTSQETLQYFGTEDLGESQSVAGSNNRSDWRLKISNTFGVDSSGTAFMTGATVSGDFQIGAFKLKPKKIRLVSSVDVWGDTKWINYLVGVEGAQSVPIPNAANSPPYGDAIDHWHKLGGVGNYALGGVQGVWGGTSVVDSVTFKVNYIELVTLVAD